MYIDTSAILGVIVYFIGFGLGYFLRGININYKKCTLYFQCHKCKCGLELNHTNNTKNVMNKLYYEGWLIKCIGSKIEYTCNECKK